MGKDVSPNALNQHYQGGAMPFADPERAKQYQRASSAARAEAATPVQPPAHPSAHRPSDSGPRPTC